MSKVGAVLWDESLLVGSALTLGSVGVEWLDAQVVSENWRIGC